ncbi:MAG TPA: hydrogenase formation protein HypD [Bacteroidales bacterium]|nr:hydrogenase formation protein HypD [Bacteroidales bacterium]
MKLVDEFRGSRVVKDLIRAINESATGIYRFMEVCGGHTAAINRFGIKNLLGHNIELVSGPGCPVCVTGTGFIDKAVRLSGDEGNIVVTFGDLLRVPGSISSLEKEKASGADIRMVFSPLDALRIAAEERSRKVIFLGIGFETTAPGTAATVMEAEKSGINNFYVLVSHKFMPPAMEILIRDGTNVNGFICPGHVAAITGSSIFDFIPEQFSIGCAVSGFEPVDILMSVLMLVNQVNRKNPNTAIQYKRAVSREGNITAKKMMAQVFEPVDMYWRGFGIIQSGGMKLRGKYNRYNAELLLNETIKDDCNEGECRCGDILRGLIVPVQCPLFGSQCNPGNPSGACMVSAEGVCNAYFRYGRNE